MKSRVSCVYILHSLRVGLPHAAEVFSFFLLTHHWCRPMCGTNLSEDACRVARRHHVTDGKRFDTKVISRLRRVTPIHTTRRAILFSCRWSNHSVGVFRSFRPYECGCKGRQQGGDGRKKWDSRVSARFRFSDLLQPRRVSVFGVYGATVPFMIHQFATNTHCNLVLTKLPVLSTKVVVGSPQHTYTPRHPRTQKRKMPLRHQAHCQYREAADAGPSSR